MSYVLSVDEDGNGTFKTGVVDVDFSTMSQRGLEELVVKSGRRVAVFEIANRYIDKQLNVEFPSGTRVALTGASLDNFVCMRSPIPAGTVEFYSVDRNEAIVGHDNFERAYGVIEYLRYIKNVDCKTAIVAVTVDGTVQPGSRIQLIAGRAYSCRGREYDDDDEVCCAYLERCNGSIILVEATAIG